MTKKEIIANIEAMNYYYNEENEESYSFWKEAVKLVETSIENESEPSCLGGVISRYLFWFEDEGKEGWTFEIEAKDHEEAFDKAYDTHGPQVYDMMYQLV